MARTSSSSSSRSGSGSSSAVVHPPVGELPVPVGRNTSGDSCSHYRLEPSQSCRQPRSCYDCLNVELPSADGGCVLNGVGACQSIDLYIPSRDYRANHNATTLSTAYINYFPSANASYCEPSDAACARCAKIATSTGAVSSDVTVGSWNGSLEAVQRFCVGTNGCVCVAACEAASWVTSVQPDCSVGDNPATMYETTDNYRTMLPLFMAIQIALILMVIHRQRMYGSRLSRRPPRPPQGVYNAEAISSPSNRLQLTGWRQMQEELVQREKAQRGLVSLMSPHSNENDSHHHHYINTSPATATTAATTAMPYHPMTIHEHHETTGTGHNGDDEDIPELPEGTPPTPRRRGSTNASVAMLEDGRMSDIIMRRPTATSICEERETRSE